MNKILFSFNTAWSVLLVLTGFTIDTNKRPEPLMINSYNQEIQVNRLPHPFNVNGMIPYQVWVDGKHVPLGSEMCRVITEALNLKFVQPEQQHNCWLEPVGCIH